MSNDDSTKPITLERLQALPPAASSLSGSVCWAAHISGGLVSVLAMVLAGKWFAPLLPRVVEHWMATKEWVPFAAVAGSLTGMLVAIAAPTSLHDLAEIVKRKIK